jgi:magnesium chelatase subunit I
LSALGIDDVDTPGLAAAGVEFALEGLYLLRRLSKESVDDRVIYGSR